MSSEAELDDRAELSRRQAEHRKRLGDRLRMILQQIDLVEMGSYEFPGLFDPAREPLKQARLAVLAAAQSLKV